MSPLVAAQLERVWSPGPGRWVSADEARAGPASWRISGRTNCHTGVDKYRQTFPSVRPLRAERRGGTAGPGGAGRGGAERGGFNPDPGRETHASKASEPPLDEANSVLKLRRLNQNLAGSKEEPSSVSLDFFSTISHSGTESDARGVGTAARTDAKRGAGRGAMRDEGRGAGQSESEAG